jgi:hypothetical protein
MVVASGSEMVDDMKAHEHAAGQRAEKQPALSRTYSGLMGGVFRAHFPAVSAQIMQARELHAGRRHEAGLAAASAAEQQDARIFMMARRG